jgi:hypothetical protein
VGVTKSESLTAIDASFLRIETDHQRRNVGSLSILEGDQLFFGLTSDRDVLPDLGRLADSIDREFQTKLASRAAHPQEA